MAISSKRMIKLTILTILLFFPLAVSAAPVIWSGDSSGRLGTIDTSTGEVNVIGSMDVIMTDIAFDPNGDLWGISFSGLYKIDKNTAATTFIGNFGTPRMNSLVFDPSGVLYSANGSLYTIDTSTGRASRVGNGGDRYTSSGDLAIIGNELFLSSSYGDDLFKIDTSDGSGSLVGDIGYSAVYGLASPDRIDLYGLSGTTVLTIDPLTGEGTTLLDFEGSELGASWGSAIESESAVPLPAAFWFLGSGLLFVMGIRKRNQNNSK